MNGLLLHERIRGRVRSALFGGSAALILLFLASPGVAQVQIVQDVQLPSDGYWQHLEAAGSERVAVWGSHFYGGEWTVAGYFAAFDTVNHQFVWNEVLREDTVNPSMARCLDFMLTDSAYLVLWNEYDWYDSVGGWFRTSHFSLDGSTAWTEEWPMSLRCAQAGVLDEDRAYFVNLIPCESFAPYGKLTSFTLGGGMNWDAQVLPYMMDNCNRFRSMCLTDDHRLAITAMTGLPGDCLWLLHVVDTSGQSTYYHYYARWDSLTIHDAVQTAVGILWTVGTTYHSPRQLFIEQYVDSTRVFQPFFTDAAACTLDAVFAPESGGLLVSAHTENGAALFRVGPEMNVWWSTEETGESFDKILDVISHPNGGYLGLALDNEDPQRYHLVRFVETGESVSNSGSIVPTSPALSLFPNPFNATTTITFDLPQAGQVRLRLLDLLGREVDQVASGRMEAGEHSITYSPTHLSSGLYFIRLETSTASATQKLVILK